MKLTHKMVALLGLFTAAFCIMGGISLIGVDKLGALQDEGFGRSRDNAAGQQIANQGAALYRVIADAVINRDLAETEKDWAAARADADANIGRLAAMVDTPEETAAAGEARKAYDAVVALFEGQMLLLLRQPGDDWNAIRDLDGRIDGQIDVIEQKARFIASSMDKEAVDADGAFDGVRKGIFTASLVAGLVLLVVGATVGLLIVRSILGQLGGDPAYAVQITRQIAGGDLATDVRVEPKDKSSLLAAMRTMRDELNTMIGRIGEGASRVLATSGQMAAAAEQISGASTRQSDSASSMSAAVEELTVSVVHVSDSSQASEQLARDTGRIAGGSQRAIQEVVNEIRTIAGDVEVSATKIADLREKSNRIYDVVNVIREVADQTNLLALNAAIEAARAGEAGRGFAVVADEVRKLAERTANSTQEISTIIDSIRDGVTDATESIAHSNDSMAKGVELANSALEAISTIGAQTDSVIASAQDIANALREQSASSSSIAQSVEQIAQMAEENSAATQEMAGSARTLDQLARDLNGLVGRFHL